jgi:hypothetical protein
MGAAALSPSSWEQRTLSYIAGELAASNLNLASTLAAFNRLTWGEEMPARQHADGIRRELGRSRRSRGRAWKRRYLHQTVTVAWPAVTASIIITAALITVALVLSLGHGTDGRQRCTPPWMVTCAGQWGPSADNATTIP